MEALAMAVSAQPGTERAQPGSPSAGGSAMSSLLAAVDDELAGAGAGPPQEAALVAGAREEPPCLRDHILPMLNLPADLPPAHFIAEKAVARLDVDLGQGRIYLRDEDCSVLRRLREILTPEELSSFDPYHDDPSQPATAEDGTVETAEQRRAKRMKTMEGNPRGLDVTLVNHCIGAVQARLMRRPLSGGAVVIRGRGYLDFVRECPVKENDVVEIWAFRQRGVPAGMVVCGEGDLHVLIAKKDERTLCCHCSLLMCSHYSTDR